MPGGVGIQVPHPLTSPEDLTRIPFTVQDMTRDFVQDKLGYVLESITLIREKMRQENLDKPLIGFSAAPYTLFYYMIGGSSKKNVDMGSYWLKHHPEASKRLLQLLTQLVIEYMTAQIEQGAHALQLFEAMGMTVNEKEFEDWCMPCLKEIGSSMRARFGNQVPLMVFARGAW
jgi:uroporphyrinogen decarboxylase